MASLQILNSGSSPFYVSHSNSRSRIPINQSLRVSCKVQGDDNRKNGGEPLESLFVRELRRRGMTPASPLNESMLGIEEKLSEGDKSYPKRYVVSKDDEKGLSYKREHSVALNRDSLEGLFLRAECLLSIGGMFFLGFWPLILLVVGSFFAIDLKVTKWH